MTWTARSLVYITGGYAFGNFNSRASGADSCNGNLTCTDYTTDHLGGSRQGWTYGVGAEYALRENWSTRIEYRRTDWGKKNTHADFDGEGTQAKLEDARINVGFMYRFAGDRTK
jgi:outer membrane immunogenic protein